MMTRIKRFINTSVIGGILVLLPIAILFAVANWAFHFVTNLIQPLTDIVIKNRGMPELVGDVLVIGIIALTCFMVGSVVATGAGRWLHNHFDKYLTQLAPGYKIIKEIVGQFFGDKSNSPLGGGDVAKVKIFGENVDTAVTAIVTSRHTDGSYTVFVPTGPNPTSGNIYHLKASQVEVIADAKVEDMMRTIISCGAGSDQLFKKD